MSVKSSQGNSTLQWLQKPTFQLNSSCKNPFQNSARCTMDGKKRNKRVVVIKLLWQNHSDNSRNIITKSSKRICLKRSVAVAVAWVLPQMSEGPNAKNSNQHYQCNFGTSKITNIHATWHDPTKQCMILNKRQSTHIDF